MRRRITPDDIPEPSQRDGQDAEQDGDALVGQERASRSLQFGLNACGSGFNVFVAGPSGIGKMELVESFARAVAGSRPTPDDLCFVHNHADPYRPRMIMLPAGQGDAFRQEMGELKNQGESAEEEIRRKAQEHGFTMKQTLMGTALVPTRDGKRRTR